MNALDLLGYKAIEIEDLDHDAVALTARLHDGRRLVLIRPGLTPEDLEAITDRIISGLVEEATKPV